MKLKTLLIAVTLATLPAAALAADQPAGKAKGAQSSAKAAPKGGKPTTGVLPDDRVLAKPAGKASAK